MLVSTLARRGRAWIRPCQAQRTARHLLYLCRSLGLAITLTVIIPHVSAQSAKTAKPDLQNAFQTDKLGLAGPKIITSVAGLTLKGKTFRERLRVPDLDIYIDKSGHRYVPLLRMLHLLRASGGIEGNLITFSVSKGLKAKIDFKRGLLLHESQSESIEIVPGVSDLTGQAELFVPEGLIKRALGIDYSWSDREFAYALTTARPLRVFEDLLLSHKKRTTMVRPVSSNLVETEGEQTPGDSRQLVSLIDASLRQDVWRISNAQQRITGITYPDVTLYGQISRGNYYLNLGNNVIYPDGSARNFTTWIKSGQWRYGATDTTVRVGDAIIGFSNLVFPSSKLFGVAVQGILGDGMNGDVGRGFLGGNRFSFMSQKRVTGYAPLGSTVELYVNNRLVDTVIVGETPGAPPGQGAYGFVASGLLTQVLNEVRVVVTQPDGTRDQHVENVVGSTDLLPAGLSAYAVAVGTKRFVSNASTQTYGMVAGGGYYYGLTRNATIGVTLATQNDYAPDFRLSNGPRLPRSWYLGQIMAYRMFDNLIFREEQGINYIHESGDTSLATNLVLSYVSNPLALSSYVFNYGRNYSNGATDVSNRRGYAVFGAPRLGFVSLGATWAHIQQVDGNRVEDYAVSQAVVPLPRARAAAFLRYDNLNTKHDPFFVEPSVDLGMYSVGLQSGPWRSTRFDMNYGWGDRISPASPGDLRYGISVPLIGSTPTYGTVAKVEHALSTYSRVGLIYRNYHQGSESAEFDISRTPRRTGNVDVAFRYKRGLERGSNNAQLNLEYPFDQKRRFIIGMNVNYSDFVNATSYDLYVTMRDLFFLDRGRFGRVTGVRQIRPQMGGLKGLVYLDKNANGHYDPGEGGVPGVQVVVDGRLHYTSGPSGYFFVGRRINEDEAVVELDENSLPAIYSPTQGRQRAEWQDYIFTRVYLGIAVLGSISGTVFHRQQGAPGRPVPGVIVKARRVADNTVVKQSITDSRGVYYLGELKPGDYQLELDGNTVPPPLHAAGKLPRVSLPVSITPTDIKDMDIHLVPVQNGQQR